MHLVGELYIGKISGIKRYHCTGTFRRGNWLDFIYTFKFATCSLIVLILIVAILAKLLENDMVLFVWVFSEY